MIDAKTIEELQGLLAKATLGPWSTHLVDDTTIMSPAREVATTCDSSQTDREDGYDIEYEQMEADAALIVAMRNALPALLDLASKTLASAREGEDSPAGILDVQRMLTIHQPTGWLARDIAIASARLQPQVSASGGEDVELCERLKVYSLAEDIMSSERRDFETAAARIHSLSAQLAEARNMLDIEKQAAQQHILERLNQRDRATASQSEIDALRERIGVLEKALEPFAEAATKGEIGGYPPNYFVGATEFENARRARTALEGRE